MKARDYWEKENFFRDKRVAHRKQARISWWEANHSFWSVSRNLWHSLPENIGVFIKSWVGCKVFVENAWAAVDKEMDFEEGKEFS